MKKLLTIFCGIFLGFEVLGAEPEGEKTPPPSPTVSEVRNEEGPKLPSLDLNALKNPEVKVAGNEVPPSPPPVAPATEGPAPASTTPPPTSTEKGNTSGLPALPSTSSAPKEASAPTLAGPLSLPTLNKAQPAAAKPGAVPPMPPSPGSSAPPMSSTLQLPPIGGAPPPPPLAGSKTGAAPPPPALLSTSTSESNAKSLGQVKGKAEPLTQGGEVAILLIDGRFHPSVVRLKSGQTVRLLFTAIQRKPAALVVERLQVQTWMAKSQPTVAGREASKRWEVNRELTTNRVTEIPLEPVKGSYSFHDAISGARGEILVE